jgi:hypothetical protein
MLAEGDAARNTYCAHPPDYLPDPDAWLAQMLALETDEAAFLRVANVHPTYRHSTFENAQQVMARNVERHAA